MTKPLLAIVMLIAAPPLFGQSLPKLQDPSKPGASRPSQASPYRNLFQPREVKPVLPAVTPKPQLVCGMSVIPANPNIDARMVLPPKGDGVKYTIRAVPPPICNPAR